MIIDSSGPRPPVKFRMPARGLLLILLLSMQLPAAADVAIDEIQVTAMRRPVSISQVPAALTVVQAETVHANKLVTDVLSAEPGVFLQQTTPGQGAVIIRGLKGSAILHLVDGVRLNNAIFRSAPTQYLALVPPGAIERIEVVRGSPTSLYGSDAVGGVVQLVTRVPRFDTSDTVMNGDAYVAFDSAELGQTYRGTLDFGSKKYSSSVSAGYVKTGDRRTGSGDRVGPSAYTAKSGRILFAAHPDEHRSWLVDLHYLEQPDTPRVDELVAGYGQTQPSSSEFSFRPNKRVFARGAYANDDGWLSLAWNFDLAWQRIDDDRVSRNYLSDVRRREANRSDLFGALLSGTRETKSGSWIVGAEVYHDTVSSSRVEEVVSSGLLQPVASRFPDQSTVRQAAIYANLSHRINRRHLLAAGVRATRVVVDLPGSQLRPAVSVNSNDLSGDIGYIFQMRETWQLIANIGRGIRAPNVFDLGTLGERPGNRFNIPNTNLTSEKVVNIDLGLRHQTERVRLELIGYWLEYDNKITSVSTGDTTADGREVVQSSNAASVSVRGIEAGLTWQLHEHFGAHAVLNYAWGEQDVSGNAAEAADRIPPLSGRLSVNYSSDRPFGFDAWMQFAGAQDRLSARDIRDPRIDPLGTTGWGILGFQANWHYRHQWRVAAGVNNILDKRYRSHGSGIDGVGRNFSISVQRSWH